MTTLIKKTFSRLAGPGGFCLASLSPGRLFPLWVPPVTACASLPELNYLSGTLSLKKMPMVEGAKEAMPANQASILPGKRWAKFPDKLMTAAALQLVFMEAWPARKARVFRSKIPPALVFCGRQVMEKNL